MNKAKRTVGVIMYHFYLISAKASVSGYGEGDEEANGAETTGMVDSFMFV